ncbi:MAG: hypothetical protein K0S39_1825 [Paenibacillus sp.]|nr:hypothetical protein [Paenibacillus sp.]
MKESLPGMDIQDLNQRVSISTINIANPFTFIEEPDVQSSVAVMEEKPIPVTIEEPDAQLNAAVVEEMSLPLTFEEPDVQLSTAVVEEQPVPLIIEEPDVQLSTAVVEEQPLRLTVEEADVQLSTAVVEEQPVPLTIEEPDIQLVAADIVEQSLPLSIEESDVLPNDEAEAEAQDEKPPLFLYIYESNVQLYKEVAELRKDIQTLTHSIKEVLQQDIRAEMNASLESLNKRYDYTSEQMLVQQQKIDDMTKLLWWKPKNHPVF